MAAEDVASAGVAAWGEGKVEGHRSGQSYRTKAVVPAWTWPHGMAARDIAVDVAARTTAGNVAAAVTVTGEREIKVVAADEATGRPR